MSMNLAFVYKSTIADFPFQTPTKLTWSVLKAPSKKNQLDLIIEFLRRPDSSFSEAEIASLEQEVKTKFDEGWKLTAI